LEQHPHQILIAVDGGGSTCRLALLRAGQRIDLTLGPANVTTDRDASIATLLDGLAQLGKSAGLGNQELAGAYCYFGLAGVMTDEDARAISARLPLDRVTIADDRNCAVTGALGAADGAVASIGTGSFVARQTDGVARYIGGWGHQLGDQASGAWLGREVLSHALKVRDGLAPRTGLIAQIMLMFDDDPTRIVDFAQTATAVEFAELAPQVVAFADRDQVAQALMADGAAYIAQGLTALGWRPDKPLCLLGGLGSHYKPFLSAEIGAAVCDPKGSALDGALELAARLAVDAE